MAADGTLVFNNPCARVSCSGIARDLSQIALAPGCVVPGRSLVALFVNTGALLWFFLYLAFDLYDSWEVWPAQRRAHYEVGQRAAYLKLLAFVFLRRSCASVVILDRHSAKMYLDGYDLVPRHLSTGCCSSFPWPES